MNVTDGQTYDGLRVAITSLINRQADPQPLISIRAESFLPVGMGGYVGQNTRIVAGEPQTDELHGRRLQGSLIITARDQSDSGIATESDRITQIMLGAERSVLLPLGLQRLTLREIGPVTGTGVILRQRDLTFDVLFELVTVPDTDPDTISEIDVSLENDGVVESFVLEEQP